MITVNHQPIATITTSGAEKTGYFNPKITDRVSFEGFGDERLKIAIQRLSPEQENNPDKVEKLGWWKSLFWEHLQIHEDGKIKTVLINLFSAKSRLFLGTNKIRQACKDGTFVKLLYGARLPKHLNAEDRLGIVDSIQALNSKKPDPNGEFLFSNPNEGRPRSIELDPKNKNIWVHLNRANQSDPIIGEGRHKRVTETILFNTGESCARLVSKKNKYSQREAVFFELFKDTPGIVKTFRITEYENKRGVEKIAFIQKKYSFSLSDAIGNGILSDQDKIQIAKDILEGLKQIHAKNVIHRDIKSENILLYKDPQTGNWRAHISDFGLACFKDEEDERRISCGSKRYLPPELAHYFNSPSKRSPTDRKAIQAATTEKMDIYALGICFRELFGSKEHSQIINRMRHPKITVRPPVEKLLTYFSQLN